MFRVFRSALTLLAYLFGTLVIAGLGAKLFSLVVPSLAPSMQLHPVVVGIQRFGNIFGTAVWNYIYSTVSGFLSRWIGSSTSVAGLAPTVLLTLVTSLISVLLLLTVAKFALDFGTGRVTISDLSNSIGPKFLSNVVLVFAVFQFVAGFSSGLYGGTEWIGVGIILVLGLYINSLSKTVFAKNQIIAAVISGFAIIVLFLSILPKPTADGAMGIVETYSGVSLSLLSSGVALLDIIVPDQLESLVMTAFLWVALKAFPDKK